MSPEEIAALRADLLADPATAEIAEDEGLTVEQYIEATIAFCQNPDAGFLGKGIVEAEKSVEELSGQTSEFEVPRAKPLLDLGAGIPRRTLLS